MSLESQVCSLELAKKLKELGVKQESIFYWVNGFLIYKRGHSDEYISNDMEMSSPGCGCCASSVKIKEYYSAFTVAELGEMLPITINISDSIFDLTIKKEYGWWCIYYLNGKEGLYHGENETEANARAETYIHLIENKLIEVQK
jgi:hypothetical protein